MEEDAGAGLESSEARPAGLGEGPGGLVLPLKLMTPAEDAGAFNEEDDGDEPEVFPLERDGEAAQENHGGPYEA